MQFQLNNSQYKFLSMPHKYRAFVGGYGSAKTWAGCLGLLYHSVTYNNIDSGYFAPTYSHIGDIFYPAIEEVSKLLGLIVDIKSWAREVLVYYGSFCIGRIICRSMSYPKKIIGYKLGYAVLDEFDVLPIAKAREVWMNIIARMRYNIAGLKNGIDIVTTPEGYKLCYELFVKNPSKKPELAKLFGIIHSNTYDNAKNLPSDYIETLKANYPIKLISAYLHGQFVNLASGTVYRSYDRKKNRSNETIQANEPLFIGMDFNVDNMFAVVAVKRGENWHIVEQLKGIIDTPAMVKKIQKEWQDNGHHITVYPDASGASRKSVNASISDIALLKKAGFYVKSPRKNPFVKDRVMSVNNAFEKLNLFIDDYHCPDIASNLEQQSYDSNGEPDKKSGCDHSNDAVGYFSNYEMPIKLMSGLHFQR